MPKCEHKESLPSARKLNAGAQRGKTRNQCQAPENTQHRTNTLRSATARSTKTSFQKHTFFAISPRRLHCTMWAKYSKNKLVSEALSENRECGKVRICTLARVVVITLKLLISCRCCAVYCTNIC